MTSTSDQYRRTAAQRQAARFAADRLLLSPDDEDGWTALPDVYRAYQAWVADRDGTLFFTSPTGLSRALNLPRQRAQRGPDRRQVVHLRCRLLPTSSSAPTPTSPAANPFLQPLSGETPDDTMHTASPGAASSPAPPPGDARSQEGT